LSSTTTKDDDDAGDDGENGDGNDDNDDDGDDGDNGGRSEKRTIPLVLASLQRRRGATKILFRRQRRGRRRL